MASRLEKWNLDCLIILQGIHALDFAMTRFAEGKAIKSGGSRKFVATLDDDRAMDLAGKFVSEGFVLAVGALLVHAENIDPMYEHIEVCLMCSLAVTGSHKANLIPFL